MKIRDWVYSKLFPCRVERDRLKGELASLKVEVKKISTMHELREEYLIDQIKQKSIQIDSKQFTIDKLTREKASLVKERRSIEMTNGLLKQRISILSGE